ncbi:hypothetical protein CTI12_AA062890 [Artemisia annua]|uniref:Uncharacterized protein n=1 Tax=Artemisia annua TaxID=35608 RepID=A0A2U1Q8B4_ARTAN|nr:hypothetical protein CTI12_AA062890 [Artemisia annua]
MRGIGGGVGGGETMNLLCNSDEMKIEYNHLESEIIDCAGREDIVCATYNAAQELRFYKQGQMTRSRSCYGRTLIAHRDGSDTMYTETTLKGIREIQLNLATVFYALLLHVRLKP